MFVGGIAANYWGMPRATFDIDVVIALQRPSIARLVDPLRKLGFDLGVELVEHRLRASNRFMTRSPRIDYRIDFWIPRTGYEQQAFRRRRTADVFRAPTWFIAPEDLVLMKLLAGRGKDREDALGVIERQAGRLNARYLHSWAKRLDLTKQLGELIKRRPEAWDTRENLRN